LSSSPTEAESLGSDTVTDSVVIGQDDRPAHTVHPIEMVWQQSTTPLEAIERSLYAMADQVSGTASEVGGEWMVLIYPRSSHADPLLLAHALRQEVTDQTLRVRIAERTDPIRNLVFAVAFSQRPAAAQPAEAPADA
jgi:His-Xaa-Ser system protein HxsD